jgi:hypothetical protein
MVESESVYGLLKR